MDGPKLEVLLRAVDRGVRRLSPQDLLDVDAWLQADPGLSAPALRAGLASLLARDAKEWREIARLVEQFCAGRLDDAGVTAVVEAPAAAAGERVSVRPQYRPEAPMPPVVRALVSVGRTGRVLVLGGALVAAVGLVIVAPSVVEGVTEAVGGAGAAGLGAEGGAVGAAPVVVSQEVAWRSVEQEALRTLMAWLPVPWGPTWTALLSALSAGLVALGLGWRRLAGDAERLSAEREEKLNTERKELEAAWVRAGAAPLHLFSVDPPPPLGTTALADSATLLGRLRVAEPSPELDVEGTATQTAGRAGRVFEVYHQRAAPLPPVVLLDLGAGDHPWRRRMERTALAWRAQGIGLDLFVFRDHDPGTVYRHEDREPFELAELGRRTEGRPLVVLSHGLTARGVHGVKAWVSALDAWPGRVWLDPEPRPPDARRQPEIDDVVARGLPRFPFHDAGVVAAMRHLVGEVGVVVPAAIHAPPVEDRAYAVWALAAAHVPDPTWDQLESFRARLPQLSRWFSDPSHVAWLVDWVEAQPESAGVALRSGGDGVAVSPALEDRLLRRWREAAAFDTALRDMAEQIDQLLLAQLSRAEPDAGTWAHAVWSLKVGWIRARLHPAEVFGSLAPVLAGPLRRAAVEMLRGELARQQGCPLPVADWTVEAQEALTDASSDAVPWSALVEWPSRRTLAFAGGLFVTIVSVEFWAGPVISAPAVAEFPATTVVNRWDRVVVQAHGMTFVEIPDGSFWMGSPASEAGRADDETRHRVTLTRPYLLATTEVTQGLFREVMGMLPDCGFGARRPGDTLPMHCVSWEDAVAFAAKLSTLDGLRDGEGYRLPTEAEWEYAARAGSEQVWAGISSPGKLCDYANVRDCGEKTAPLTVGRLLPNAWGLHDMSGNVWEWTSDWYDASYGSEVSDPRGPPQGSNRVNRGGSFAHVPANARVANRNWFAPSRRYDFLGFRLARSFPSALLPFDPLQEPADE